MTSKLSWLEKNVAEVAVDQDTESATIIAPVKPKHSIPQK